MSWSTRIMSFLSQLRFSGLNLGPNGLFTRWRGELQCELTARDCVLPNMPNLRCIGQNLLYSASTSA